MWKIEKDQKAKTKEQIKEIDLDAAEVTGQAVGAIKDAEHDAHVQAKKSVSRVSQKELEATIKELDELADAQDQLLTELKDNAHDTAAEVLGKVEKNAEEKAGLAAQAAVDERMAIFHEKSENLRLKAAEMHGLSANITVRSQAADTLGRQAIRLAHKAAEVMPKAEAKTATKISKKAVKLSKELHLMAANTEALSKIASQVATLANQNAAKAEVIAKEAKVIAEQAVEQSGKNAQVMKQIRAVAAQAMREAKKAAHRARVAVWRGTGANATYAADKLIAAGHPTAMKVPYVPPTQPPLLQPGMAGGPGGPAGAPASGPIAAPPIALLLQRTAEHKRRSLRTVL